MMKIYKMPVGLRYDENLIEAGMAEYSLILSSSQVFWSVNLLVVLSNTYSMCGSRR